MSTLNSGRIAIVTGAGAGIGRSHALALAASGAQVVVNDIATATDALGRTPAAAIVAQIVSDGGTAVANGDDVSTDDGARGLVETALRAFGGLHVLVNNAGILRDRMFVNMTEQEWDAVIAVFTIIISQELARYGVTVNAVAPRALTAMTENLPRYQELAAEPGGAQRISPDHISPVVTWLASPLSRGVTGRVFGVAGTTISVYEGWHNGPTVTRDDGQWTAAELADLLPDLVAKARPNAGMTGDAPSSQGA